LSKVEQLVPIFLSGAKDSTTNHQCSILLPSALAFDPPTGRLTPKANGQIVQIDQIDDIYSETKLPNRLFLIQIQLQKYNENTV